MNDYHKLRPIDFIPFYGASEYMNRNHTRYGIDKKRREEIERNYLILGAYNGLLTGIALAAIIVAKASTLEHLADK